MIQLFYYNINNLGDILSYWIVSKLSKQTVRFSYPLSLKNIKKEVLEFGHYLYRGGQLGKAVSSLSCPLKPVIIAVGSLLEHSTINCIAWGTGMAQQKMIPSGGRFRMTRGYLSKRVLESAGFRVESKICGDPALLMPLLYSPDTEMIPDRVGVIPHMSEVNQVRDYLKSCSHIDIIDFRTHEVEKTINKLLSYPVVYSSSLHGLILCHAYGIPCIWFQNNVLTGGDFKFLDHFSAVGIMPYRPLSVNDIKNGKRLPKAAETVSHSHIEIIQNELLKMAPFRIRYFDNSL